VVDKAAAAGAFAERGREITPLGNRSQSLVQEHDRRNVAGARAEPAIFDPALVDGDVLAGDRPNSSQLNLTYSQSTGRLWMPVRGGAIQFANCPGLATRPLIIAWTNA